MEPQAFSAFLIDEVLYATEGLITFLPVSSHATLMHSLLAHFQLTLPRKDDLLALLDVLGMIRDIPMLNIWCVRLPTPAVHRTRGLLQDFRMEGRCPQGWVLTISLVPI